MPQLPHDRLVELDKLYGEYRNAPFDEIGKRLQVFRNACIKAAEDYDGAIGGEEMQDTIARRWHAKNKIKPSDVKR